MQTKAAIKQSRRHHLLLAAVGLLLALVAALFVVSQRAEAEGQVVVAEVFVPEFQNVRSGPNVLYDSLTVISKGTVLELTARTKDGSWALTRVNDQSGWVAVSQLKLYGSMATLPIVTEFPPVAVVATDFLNVRKGPGFDYPVALVVAKETRLYLIGRDPSANWALVLIDIDTVGWVGAGAVFSNVPIDTLPEKPFPPVTDFIVVPPVDGGGDMPPANGGGGGDVILGTIVGAERLNVRQGPGQNHLIVQTIDGGDQVVLLKRTPGTTHIKVRVFDGTEGWVPSNYVLSAYDVDKLEVYP